MDKIQPDDINAKQHLFDAFDNAEREIGAGWIVRFCQERGRGWKPFTVDDIEQYYNERGFTDFLFSGLVSPEYGIRQEGEAFYIEHKFITRCWKSSPREN